MLVQEAERRLRLQAAFSPTARDARACGACRGGAGRLAKMASACVARRGVARYSEVERRARSTRAAVSGLYGAPRGGTSRAMQRAPRALERVRVTRQGSDAIIELLSWACHALDRRREAPSERLARGADRHWVIIVGVPPSIVGDGRPASAERVGATHAAGAL